MKDIESDTLVGTKELAQNVIDCPKMIRGETRIRLVEICMTPMGLY